MKQAGASSGQRELLPLTAAQHGMWFAESLSPEYSVNVAYFLSIRDETAPLDLDSLAACVLEASREFESPYTRLVDVDGIPMQEVDLDLDLAVRRLDLRDADNPMQAAREWMNRDYQAGVDLLSAPLAAIALIRVADDHTLLYVRGHHILLDGYSSLTSLLSALQRYNAQRAGTEFTPTRHATLAELVADDETYRNGSRRERDREYWVEQAADLPERASLARHDRTAALAPQNVVAGDWLSADLQRRIEQVAKDSGYSVAVLLVTAFAAFMSRMSGTDDVVLSLPVTGRATARIKNAGGMLSNMLPIRARDVSRMPMVELARQLQNEMTGALRHQRYRFEDIRVDAGMGDGNSASFGPIVNMMFFDKPIEVSGAKVEYHILSSGILEDLRLNLYQAAPGALLAVDLHGNPNLYDAAELESHLARFVAFIPRLLDGVDRPIGEIELLLPGESDRLIAAGLGTRTADVDADRTVLDRIDRSIAQTPDAVALDADGERTTYREFGERRNALAARLIADGVGRGSRVVVSLDRGAMQVIAIHAVLACGAAYVPLEPGTPPDRRRGIVETVDPVVVIDDAYLDVANSDRYQPTELPGPGMPGSPAYVIFTSGSTGKPKGVEVSHAALCNRLTWMQDHYPISADDTVLYKTPFTFDVSVWELVWPLMHGARMAIARPGGHRDPIYLADLIRRAGVTTLHFVPSMLELFVDSGEALPDNVRTLFASGEALNPALGNAVLERSNARVVNLYGPTEAAIDVTEYVLTDGDEETPIGRPVPNTDVLVLDPRLRPVPVGVAGELYLAGAQLAIGYLGRPELTADRFVANPYGGPGARMYRTGDLVSRRTDDNLLYHGRTDFQIKIRGQRVELGEIESVLRGHPQVEAAVALARTGPTGIPMVVAYVRPHPTTSILPDDLTAVCRRQLPSHMVPSAVVVVDEFPVTDNGKLDRGALPEPDLSTHEVEYVAPRSPAEEALADLIAAVLGLEATPSVMNHLFGLGGDSLAAARVVSRARRELDLHFGLAEIFDGATIADLVAGASSGAGTSQLFGARSARPASVPLSPAQSRLWLVNRIEPDSATYNMAGTVTFDTSIDLDVLAQAIGDVVERHEPLRTTFPVSADSPVQHVHGIQDVAIEALIAEISASATEVEQLVLAEASRGFDLGTELPFRATIVRSPDVEAETLLIVLHHIAGDGASLAPLIRDLSIAYAARRGGRRPEWRPLAGQYADYAIARLAELGEPNDTDSRAHRDLTFWRTELQDLPDILELPTDRPRPRVATGAGDTRRVDLPAEVTADVVALADRTDTTPFLVAHAAMAIVLGRMADTDDVPIGVAVHGRDGVPELDDMVGMFVNTVVLRSRPHRELSVRDFMTAGRRTFGAALDHSALPFEDVVDALAPNRSLAHTPLFQVAMTWQDDPLAAHAEGTVRALRLPVAKTDLEVSLTVSPAADSATPTVTVEFGYATDLFDADTIDRICSAFLRVLRGMTADETRTLGSLDLTAAPVPVAQAVPPSSLATVLAAGADLAGPAATAVTSGSTSITYGELAEHSNRLGRELIDRGVGPGDVVAVAIPRSDTSVLATLAIVAAGAGFVLIDPTQPSDRRAEMIADSRAVLGICSDRLDVQFTGDGSDVPWLRLGSAETDAALASRSAAEIGDGDRRRGVHLDDTAYLIFTSGSTGRPKATAISHRGLANFAANLKAQFGAGPGSRVLHVSSPSFDASVLELVTALSAGAELVVSPADVYGGEQLAALIADHGVTHALMTPSVLATVEPNDVPSLTTVLSGGEAIPAELAHRWSLARAGEGGVFNLYGPTEATVWVTVDGPLAPDAPITIGAPLPGVDALVLDSSLRPAPIGVPGELYVAGDQTGLGYLGRMGLTSRSFVAHPFAVGQRMYRTGDRVSLLADGRLVYHGRTDFQLKIRGLRIEPGEVDAVIGTHPDVNAVVSVGVSGPDGRLTLATYVAVDAGADVGSEQIMAFARSRLPKYLVPQAVSVMDVLPTTSVGKIDRRALPAIEFASADEMVAPRTGTEAVIAGLMAQILGLEEVSVTESFFDLGGNSLSATKLVSRLSAVFDRRVSVREVFDAPSTAELAVTVDSASRVDVDDDTRIPTVPVLSADRRADDLPVSAAQRGMWLLNQADPESAAYNIGLVLELRGGLNVDALDAAVGDLVGRHEALRTVYPSVDGTPVQRILASSEVSGHVRLDVVEAAVDQTGAVEELAARGFELADHPPVRLALLPVGDASGASSTHLLVFVVHHIAADGASMVPLARDLMIAYAARAGGAAPAWLPLSVQYADYAVWQADRLAEVGPDGRTREDSRLDYWQRRLAGVPEVLEIPADRRRPKTPSFGGDQVPVHIPARVAADLDALARRNGSTLFMVLHAAFAVLLHRVTGQEQVVIGTPHAGRAESSLDDVVGMFVNSVPLRTQVRPTDELGSLVRRVANDDLADLAHADVPFESIVARLLDRPSGSHNPIFQVMFSFQNFAFPELELAGLQVAGRDPAGVSAQVDLQLTLRPEADAAGNLQGRLVYATDLFDRERIERLAERFMLILESVIDDDAGVVGDVDIRLDDERSVPESATEEPERLAFADLIAQVVEAAPDAVAVSDAGTELTFGQVQTSLTAMAAVVGDPDAALTMVLMGALPSLATAGPEAFGEVLEQVRTRAGSVLDGGGARGDGEPGNRSPVSGDIPEGAEAEGGERTFGDEARLISGRAEGGEG